MSVNIGEPGTPPMLFYSDPEQLMNHLIETNGMDAVMGMAEVAAWCEAPARAIGRYDVRRRRRRWTRCSRARRTNRSAKRSGPRMFGSVMDVVDRHLPDTGAARDAPRHARVPLGELHLPRPVLPGSAMCLAFAMAAPGTQMIRKVKGGIGALCAHVQRLFEADGGEVRLHAKVEEILTDGGRVTGVRLVDGEVDQRARSSSPTSTRR